MHTSPSLPAPGLADIGLMQPMATALPFTSAGWSFELPLQGCRLLAECAAGRRGRLLSAGGVDVSRRFPELTQALAMLPGGRKVFDAELCVLDASGRNDPWRLRERALRRAPGPGMAEAVLILHDLLVLDGLDARPLPWTARRRLLRQLPLGANPALQLKRTLTSEGEWLYRQAGALGRKALYARQGDAPYVSGCSPAWLAIPCATPAPVNATAGDAT